MKFWYCNKALCLLSLWYNVKKCNGVEEIKGQLISKGHFGFFNSPKKQTKIFCPSRLGKKFDFQVRFLGERHFEINGPLEIQILKSLFWDSIGFTQL